MYVCKTLTLPLCKMEDALDVVELVDSTGSTAGYATGTTEGTLALARLRWTGTNAAAQETAVEFLRSSTLQRARERRSDVETTSSVLVNGHSYSADSRLVSRLLGHLAIALRDPQYRASTITYDGSYVELDAEGVYAACVGVLAFLRACANWEDGVRAQIVAATNVSELQAIAMNTTPDFSTGVPIEALAELPGSIASTVVTCSQVTTRDIVASGTASIAGATSTGDLTSAAARVDSLDAGAGTIRTTGDVFGGTSTLGHTMVTALTAGPSELGATVVSSLDAQSGQIRTTGGLAAGGATLTSLDVGSGPIVTTGMLQAGDTTLGATTVNALVVGEGGISTGSLDTQDLSAGPSSLGATVVDSLDAQSGFVRTTGDVIAGTLTVSGASVLASVASTSADASDVVFARSGGGGKQLRVRGAASDPSSAYAAQVVLENGGQTLARVSASALEPAGINGRLAFGTFGNGAWVDVLIASGSGLVVAVPCDFGANAVSTTGPLSCGSATTTDLSSRNASVSGTLGVAGATSLASALTVNGVSTLAALIAVNTSVNGSLEVLGATTLANASVGGSLGVTGASTLAALSAGNTALSGTLAVSGASTLSSLSASSVSSSGPLSAAGNTTLASLSASSVSCTGAAAISGSLTVSGTTTAGACTLNSTGMGIGMAPSNKLDISGQMRITNSNSRSLTLLYPTPSTTTGNEIYFDCLASGPLQEARVGLSGSARNFYLWVAGYDRLNITTDGKVGIGTASPSYNLHVSGTLGVTGASALAAVTCSSLNAGTGTIQTTGSLNVGSSTHGAITCTSLNAQSGTIQTTGSVSGGSVASSGTLSVSGQTSLNGNASVVGTLTCAAITSTSSGSSDILFARSTAGDKYVRVRGNATNPSTTVPAQLLLENGSSVLARVSGAAYDAAGTDGRLLLSVYNGAWVDVFSARSTAVSILAPLNLGSNAFTSTAGVTCASVNAGSGTVQTTGTLSAGATTLGATACSSLTASAGGVTTTALTASGDATLASLSASSVSSTGTLNVVGSSTLAAVSASSLSVSGQLTASGAVFTNGMQVGDVYVATFDRLVAATANSYTNICTIDSSYGALVVQVDLIQNESGASIASSYVIDTKWSVPASTASCLPISTSGPYWNGATTEEIGLEAYAYQAILRLYLVRLSGNRNSGIRAVVRTCGPSGTTITASTATGTLTSLATAPHPSTVITQVGGRLGVNRPAPAATLDVNGSLNAGATALSSTLAVSGAATLASVSCASLNAGSGTVQTTGTLTAGSCTLNSTGIGIGMAASNPLDVNGKARITNSTARTLTLTNPMTATTSVNEMYFDSSAIGASQTASVGMTGTARNFFVSVGGSDRLNITTGGNVGIGTTSPSYSLHVSGTMGVTGASTLAAITCTSLNAGTGAIQTTGSLNVGTSTQGAITCSSLNAGTGSIQTTGSLNVGTSTQGAITCTSVSSGTVTAGSCTLNSTGLGIGMTASNQLDVSGQARITNSTARTLTLTNPMTATASVNELYFDSSAIGTSQTASIGMTGMARNFFVSVGGSDRLNITTGGNVGIGTTSPSYSLHVSGTMGVTGASTLAAITCTSLNAGTGSIQTTGSLNVGTSTQGAITCSSLNAGTGSIQTTGSFSAGTSTQGAITCTSVSSGTITAGACTLNSTGMGIGTTPSNKLDISGQARITNSNSRSLTLLYPTPSTTTGNEIYFDCLASGPLQEARVGLSGSARNFYLWVAGYDRLNITTDGKVGIGTATPSYRLHVSGTMGVTGEATLAAVTCSSLDAGSGSIQTTGSINVGTSTQGAITCTSLNAGTGSIQTTGALNVGTSTQGAITCASLNAGTGMIQTTGSINVGTSTQGAITCTSLNAGTGSIQTTGSFSAGTSTQGAITCTSLSSGTVSAGSCTINSTGVGIGITASNPLDVSGQARITNSTTRSLTLTNPTSSTNSGNEVYFDCLASGASQIAAVGMSGTARNFFVSVGGSDRLNITTSGNVGIGTTSPSYSLHVSGTLGVTGASTLAALTCTSLNAGSGSIQTTGSLNVGTSTQGAITCTSLNAGSGSIQTTGTFSAGTSSQGAITCASLNSGTVTAGSCTINSTGVGIGTTASNPLDVSGQARITNSTTRTLTLLNPTASTNSGNEVYFDCLASGASQSAAVGMSGTARNFFVSVGGSDRLNITTSGNVGIGTTSPSYSLHVSGTLGVTGATTLAAVACTSLNAGTGSIQTTGTLNVGTSTQGAITCTSLNAGTGTIQTTGSLNVGTSTQGAITCISLNAGTGSIQTTGSLNVGTSTQGAITCTSLNAGSGTIQTTGSLNVGTSTQGAITCTSLNAGSGTVQTTGDMTCATLTAGGTYHRTYAISLASTVSSYADICTIDCLSGAKAIWVDLVQSETGASNVCSYALSVRFESTAQTHLCLPITTTGPYTGTEDVRVEAYTYLSAVRLYAVRVSGSKTNIRASVRATCATTPTFTAGTATGTLSAQASAVHPSSAITQRGGQVGVNVTVPSATLDVNGSLQATSISSSGALSATGTSTLGLTTITAPLRSNLYANGTDLMQKGDAVSVRGMDSRAAGLWGASTRGQAGGDLILAAGDGRGYNNNGTASMSTYGGDVYVRAGIAYNESGTHNSGAPRTYAGAIHFQSGSLTTINNVTDRDYVTEMRMQDAKLAVGVGANPVARSETLQVTGAAYVSAGMNVVGSTTLQSVVVDSIRKSDGTEIGAAASGDISCTSLNAGSGTIQTTGPLLSGNASVNGTLGVTGASTLASTTVTGPLVVDNGLNGDALTLGKDGKIVWQSRTNASGDYGVIQYFSHATTDNPWVQSGGTDNGQIMVRCGNDTGVAAGDSVLIDGMRGIYLKAFDQVIVSSALNVGRTAVTNMNGYTVSINGGLLVDAPTTQTTLCALQSAASTKFQVDKTGNTTIGGSLTVSGSSSLAAVSASSVSSTGTLSATGNTTLASLSASSVSSTGTLSASGNTTLGSLSATGNTTLASLSASSVSSTGTLSATGNTTLASLSASSVSSTGTLSASGNTTLASITTSGNATISGKLSVTSSTTSSVYLTATGSVAVPASSSEQTFNIVLSRGTMGKLTAYIDQIANGIWGASADMIVPNNGNLRALCTNVATFQYTDNRIQAVLEPFGGSNVDYTISDTAQARVRVLSISSASTLRWSYMVYNNSFV